MSKLLVHANEATAAQRRVYFHLVDATDGITAETGEAGGQPQISSDGGAWTNTGIGTLSAIGSGRYYADLTQALVATAGTQIETRYKSANTAECPGDSVQVVAFDPNDIVRLGLTALPNAAADAAGGLPISDAGGLDLDAKIGALTYGTANRVNAQVYGMEAGTVTAAAVATGAIDADAIADNAIDAGAIADGAITAAKIATDAITADKIAANAIGASEIADGAITAAKIATDAIDADALAADAIAEINATVDTALADIKLDHLVAVADADDPVDNSIIAKLASKSATADWSSFVNTTDSLEANRDNTGTAGAGLTDLGGMSTTMKAQVEAEVDDALGSGTGTALTAVPWNAAWDAEVQSEVADALDAAVPGSPTADSLNERIKTLDDAYTATRGGYLDELSAANLPADIDQIKADLPQRITKNTALAGFTFLMVDSTDHVTPKTGLTITATRSLDGAAFASCTNSASEISAGFYKIDLAAGDLNGNVVALKFTASGADQRSITIVTEPT